MPTTAFPKSHAASFALLVYVSAWIKCHYPAAFACALLNSQPMGFYAPAQIIGDARRHGVEVLPVDINHSGWDCTLEPVAPPSELALRHPRACPGGPSNDVDGRNKCGHDGEIMCIAARGSVTARGGGARRSTTGGMDCFVGSTSSQ